MNGVKIRKHKKVCNICGYHFFYTIKDVEKVTDMITNESIGLLVRCPLCREEHWII